MHQAVIQTAFLGDLLLSIPLFKSLKNIKSDAKLILCARKGIGEFLLELGLIDELIEVSKGDSASYKKARQKMNEFEIENLIVPHQSFRSGLLAKSIKAKKKISFDQLHTRFFYDVTIKREMNFPDAIRQLSLAGVLDDKLADYFVSLREKNIFKNKNNLETLNFFEQEIPEILSMSLRDRILDSIDTSVSKGSKVVVSPGSVWRTKMWTVDGYKQLVSRLVDQGKTVVLMGSSAERDLCEEIRGSQSNVENFCGENTLIDSLKIMATSEIVVCNDSGAQHMAAVAGTPSVSIFGPTTLNLGYRPWQQKSVIVQKDLSCRPCGKHGSNKCPIGTHECMKSIDVSEVLLAIKSISL